MSGSNKTSWLALIGVSILSFTAFLDFTIVNTALPAIQIDLHASVLKLQWVINIYAIVLSMLMIMAGKFSDIFGKRKIFYIGALIFIIAAIGAGFAPNINLLIFFRAIQGIAGAIIFIGGISLVPTLFPNENQAQAIGIYSAITGLGLGIGPFLAGILVSLLSWRWVFFINIPIVVIGFLLCAFILKETEKQENVKIDWIGFILLIGFVVCLLVGLIHGETTGWDSNLTLIYFLVAFISLVLLLITQSKFSEPLLDLSIFTNKKTLLSIVICMMAGVVSYELFFFDPIYLSAIRNLPAFYIGLALLAVPGSQVIISIFWGKIANKFNIEHVIVVAIFCGVVTSIMHLFFGVSSSYYFIILAFLLIGVVWGVANSGGIGLAIQNVKPEKVGSSIGTIATTWNITGAMSIAIGSVLFNSNEKIAMHQTLIKHNIVLNAEQHSLISTMLSDPTRAYQLLDKFTSSKAHEIMPYFKISFLTGFQAAVWFSVGVLIIGFLASLFLLKRK